MKCHLANPLSKHGSRGNGARAEKEADVLCSSHQLYTEPQQFPLYCRRHNKMVAVKVVRDNLNAWSTEERGVQIQSILVSEILSEYTG